MVVLGRRNVFVVRMYIHCMGAKEKDPEMVKINIRLPKTLLEKIDNQYGERGYPNRSEAIRDALRTWADPPTKLSEEFLELLKEGKNQKKQEKYTTLEELDD